MPKLIQIPAPGKHRLFYCGDCLEVTLTGDTPLVGKAFISTNIGNAALQRKEIIERVEDQIIPGAQDWRNIPMEQVDECTFKIRLALTEEGHFEFKCCLADGKGPPIWVDGENANINVSPAPYCCSNTIYCAFVRQFGMNKNKRFSTLPDGVTGDGIEILDKNMYSVIPPSGTFRDMIKELDHIINTLKCRIIHLLPINQTPTIYARMGRYGSPYASLDFTSVDPALAEFDKKASPLDQFIELVDAIHRKDAKLVLDIAINHTGWASELQEEHPEWFIYEPDGTVHSPGAWGVVWGDLIELDHNNEALWKYLADMFLVWCSRGVDGFRCDAGYMIPVNAWKYIIAKVREEYPETVFLLEGLGGDPSVTARLLNQADMNWAYSELFQNYSRQQVEGYLRYAWSESVADGVMVNYAETHDNSRLAAISKKYARMRTALCALTSTSGAFGFANGVEWFAEEKIDVHESSALNWGSSANQIDFIARLNIILAVHSSFHDGATLIFIDSGSPDIVLFSRTSWNSKEHLLIAVNLNCDKGSDVIWNASNSPIDSENLTDLLSGRTVEPAHQPGNKRSISLSPCQACALTDHPEWLAKIIEAEAKPELIPDHIEQQEAAAMALRLLSNMNSSHILMDENPQEMAHHLRENPELFLNNLYSNECEPLYIRWEWPTDLKREVMIPPRHAILITAPSRFRFILSENDKIIAQINGLCDSNGRYFAVLPPLSVPEMVHKHLQATIAVFTPERLERDQGHLMLLASDIHQAILRYTNKNVYNASRVFLQANGRGAILYKGMSREDLESRYDAILLANLNPDYPEDRHVMWRRMRIWVVYNARFQEVKSYHAMNFHMSADGGGVWEYDVPVGNGLFIELITKLEIINGENAVVMTVKRRKCLTKPQRLSDSAPVYILVRPDIEDRNFHHSTKASTGPEKIWPGQIFENETGFEFRAAPDRVLKMQSSKGTFMREDKWLYMIHQRVEAMRGLDPNTDLYSPGYFRFTLDGSETAYISGQVITSPDTPVIPPQKQQNEPFEEMETPLEATMLYAMRQFIVKRGNLKTVIAGYPWFLDWGRDTLIASRGLIASPEFREDVRAILIQFARFAEKGTIPNMISGNNADNRDTSDAQLWLFVACSDLCRAEGSMDFLNTEVRDGETLLEILESLADGIIIGTPNGIICDPASSLIFSPAHFTWMDTNYPAGTPREGYPIEIQALWYAALSFLASAASDQEKARRWTSMADAVRQSVLRYFVLPEKNYLSDCLHCRPGTSADRAVADDHLRPNQLFAITLGLIQDMKLQRGILLETEKLLVPGAIRTLADREVHYQMPVEDASGRLLNNPSRPYWGRYEGDEDTRRKPAYHNGTAWTWVFPSYCEAYMMVYGKFGENTAKSILSSMVPLMEDGCIGQIPEIMDGDYPHILRGCQAQAWGITEMYRIWKLLHKKP